MARLTKLTISGYRSINQEISIHFPKDKPLVLVGENNAGKSNIIRSLDLVLGEMWPGSREPDDHEFWGRSAENGKIEIVAEIDGLPPDRYSNSTQGFRWQYDSSERSGVDFKTIGGKFINNEMRDHCVCIVIGADRKLSYQLSYATKWTLLSKLMKKFHTHLNKDEGRVNRLKETFDQIKGIFGEVTEFASFQSTLKKQFGEMFAGMSYGLQIDFSAYDPSNYFQSLRVQPDEEGQMRTFEELGTGQEQLLALAFAHAYAKAFFGGILLVIEEPEAHLHPLAQQWLAKHIHAMARDGLQIVLTTHNPAFIDLMNLEGVILVRKTDDGTTVRQLTADDLATYCKQHGADVNRTKTDSILPFYSGHATQDILEGLFAKKIILVEGQTEALALPVYFTKAKLDVTREGIAIIPVLGKGNLAKWWRFFTAYGIPTYMAFDNDAKDEDQDGKRRKDALQTLGIDAGEVSRAIVMADWNVTNSYCVFGKDYEASLRTNFSAYVRLEKEANDALGNSKPLVARYVAEKLEFSDSEAGWKKIKELANAIKKLELPREIENQPDLEEDDIPF